MLNPLEPLVGCHHSRLHKPKEESEMKRMFAIGALALLVGVLLVPGIAAARRGNVVGSLTIRGDNLPNRLVGIAVVSNPGLEKTMVQQIPPFTVPVILDVEFDDSSNGPRILNKNLDTNVVLTNVSTTPLTATLTLRDGDGNEIGSVDVQIPGNGTRALSLADAVTQRAL
jgi:hypothetical protein